MKISNNKALKSVLNRPMSRAEFLKMGAFGLVAILGGGVILSALKGMFDDNDSKQTHAKQVSTYGIGSYGS